MGAGPSSYVLCDIIGHKLRSTVTIEPTEDFYEVEDAVVCVRCGKVNPAAPLLMKAISTLLYYATRTTA